MSKIDVGSKIVTLTISGKNQPDEFLLENVRTMKQIKLPSQSVNIKTLKKKWSHLENIDLQLICRNQIPNMRTPNF
ncbi:unnamed protein product [Allacma fusca]|uniref:Uncharacterized protein n=1 Tax=Allacma fusca TaxID=39272 RepID=A0A8J2LKX3_9HEXA|nr:unnamed protein product [Allacma fusca]